MSRLEAPWLKDAWSGRCFSVAIRSTTFTVSRSSARAALRSIFTCWGGQEQQDGHKRLPQCWLGKPRALSWVTSGLDLCFAAAAASFSFSGSQHLIAAVAQMTCPLGFPSPFALISLAPSLFFRSLCMISALICFITKVTQTVRVHSER